MMIRVGLLVALALLVVACQPQDKSLLLEDENNPHFRQAMVAQRERNYVEAAKAYEAALQAAPTVARAHFELGLLYADRLNDPISALYHWQRYLRERPNADNREGAEKRFESIKIQFAATAPNSPIQNAEAFAKLQGDNQSLLREVEDARAKITELEGKLKVAQTELSKAAPPVQVAAPVLNVVKDTPDGRMEVPVGASSNTQPAAPVAPVVETTPTVPVVPSAPVVQATPAEPAAPPVAADREHVIVSGDTLWKIAKVYYPKQITAGIEKIKKANTEVLPEGKPLKIGTKIKIPAN